MRTYLLAENNWKNLKTERFELAVMAWGATEAHNYHLPYGTDVYEGDAIATEAARKATEKNAKVIVLPTIPFGVNTGQSDIYLDINLNPTTQMAIIRDILTVLNRQNIKKFLILNSHGGNDFKPMLRQLGLEFPEMLLSFCNFYQVLDKSNYFEEDGDHADEMETSLMMHLQPQLVSSLNSAGMGKEKKHKVRGIREKWAWAERKWSEVSEDTGIGNPKKSTAEKGERYFNDLTDKISDLFVDLSNADLNDLYQ
ncbi:MAG: creatininase family protein [Flavobacteriaceae bacterium]|jgi:creatinine amidohydrolase|nr:creatininase family protein [Flavobacteriaceae bacterium]